MIELNGKERKHLRGLAHHLDPRVHIGKHGLTEAVVEEVDGQLDEHELIKIKFVDHKREKKEIADELARRLHAAVAGTVGHLAILYRPAPRAERRRIELPRRGDAA
ncbi:MAG: ribosome assembly RNA-binding protein YhbY [Acidobacteriota bacterium]